MANNFKNFMMGKSRNNMNVSGLMFLLVLILPNFILDMVWIGLYMSGQPWIDFTAAIGQKPYFAAWGFACFIITSFNIFFLCRAIRNNRDPRITDDDDPLKDTKI